MRQPLLAGGYRLNLDRWGIQGSPDKERTARYSKKSAKEAAKQTELMQQMLKGRQGEGEGPG